MWLSIIIPVYNAEKYLDTCLASILSQPSEDFQVIAIDDGSTDRSWQKLEDYQKNDRRLITYKNPVNKLVGHARNIGIHMAEGDFLWFVDADDWINPQAIDLIYQIIRIHTEADIFSFGYCEQYLTNGRKESYPIIPGHKVVEQDGILGFLQLQKGFSSMPFSYIFKRTFLENHCLSFPEGTYFEDIYFMGKAFYYASSIAIFPRIFYNYNRINIHSITLQHNKEKILDLLEMYGALQAFLEKEGEWEKYRTMFAFRFISYGLPRCFRMFFGLPYEDRKDANLRKRLGRLKRARLMGLASLLKTSEWGRKLSFENGRLRTEISRNIRFLLMVKYAFPLLVRIHRIMEIKRFVKSAVHDFFLKFFPLQTFDRMPD